MINFPDVLSLPSIDYKYKPMSRNLRTTSETGKIRVRKKYHQTPTIFSVTFVFNTDQLGLFESFFENCINSGSDYFNIFLLTGSGLNQVEARFIETYEVKYKQNDYWTVKTDIEVEKPYIYSKIEFDELLSYYKSNGSLNKQKQIPVITNTISNHKIYDEKHTKKKGDFITSFLTLANATSESNATTIGVVVDIINENEYTILTNGIFYFDNIPGEKGDLLYLSNKGSISLEPGIIKKLIGIKVENGMALQIKPIETEKYRIIKINQATFSTNKINISSLESKINKAIINDKENSLIK